MALSEDQIIDLFNEACRETFSGLERFRHFARAIEAAVRKQDEALIRQMLDALENSHATLWEEEDDPSRPAHAAITAARARLESKP